MKNCGKNEIKWKTVVRMRSNEKPVVRMKSKKKPVVRMRSTVSVSDQETRIRLLKYHLIHFNSKNSLKEWTQCEYIIGCWIFNILFNV